MASFRPALTEAPQRMTEPHWDRPVNSGPRPCHLMLDSPYQGSRTGLPPPISTSVPGTPQPGYAALIFAAGGNDPSLSSIRARLRHLRRSPFSPSRFIDSSMVSVSPDVDREGAARGAPHSDVAYASPGFRTLRRCLASGDWRDSGAPGERDRRDRSCPRAAAHDRKGTVDVVAASHHNGHGDGSRGVTALGR